MTAPQGVFLDMPLHIKENIMGRLDFAEKMCLRRCSKSIKEVVDNSRTFIKKVWLTDNRDGYKLELLDKSAEYFIHYNNHQDGHVRIVKKAERSSPNEQGYRAVVETRNTKDYSEGVTPIQALFADMAFLFRNTHRVTVGMLDIDNYALQADFFEDLRVILSNLRDPLPVRRLLMSFNIDRARIMKVLPYLKAGTLQRIELQYISEQATVLDEVRNTEQWNQAALVSINGNQI